MAPTRFGPLCTMHCDSEGGQRRCYRWAAARGVRAVLGAFGILAVAMTGLALAQEVPNYLRLPDGDRNGSADSALIISVDVSQSVDEQRYRLQMEGIAQALEDPDVITAITTSPSGGMLVTMIAWSDKTEIVLPWRWIASAADARATAQAIRLTPHKGGEFTCMGRMFRVVHESILTSMPRPANYVMLDVSSDGIDNCYHTGAVDEARDRLVAAGVTINGNPILVPGENDTVGAGAYRAPGFGLLRGLGPDSHMTTLDAWYREHVLGGYGAFMLPAQGYGDFARAIKRKFVTEISMAVEVEAVTRK